MFTYLFGFVMIFLYLKFYFNKTAITFGEITEKFSNKNYTLKYKVKSICYEYGLVRSQNLNIGDKIQIEYDISDPEKIKIL